MMAIPAGSFLMGSPLRDDPIIHQNLEVRDDEKPQHPVTIRAFFIGKYEITQA